MRFLVTIEHASNRIPDALGRLGLSGDQLQSHIAWDPGALDLGTELSKVLGASLLEGEWSRLVADLNRSETNPRVVPARAFGVDVPGNAGLSRGDVKARLEMYWRPFRAQAREIVEKSGTLIHLSIHTFTPTLDGQERRFDLAALYDPAREGERELAGEIVRQWAGAGWRARRNEPYRGVADGHTTALRRQFPPERYLGIEVEVNQRRLGQWPMVIAAVAGGIAKALEKQKARR
jgi:predicted N-formylglutamate amidohydrolase